MDNSECIEDIKRWYSGNWNGFKFIEDGKHFTVTHQESYSSKWVLAYNDPSTHISGGGITISESELWMKLLTLAMAILIHSHQDEYLKRLTSIMQNAEIEMDKFATDGETRKTKLSFGSSELSRTGMTAHEKGWWDHYGGVRDCARKAIAIYTSLITNDEME